MKNNEWEIGFDKRFPKSSGEEYANVAGKSCYQFIYSKHNKFHFQKIGKTKHKMGSWNMISAREELKEYIGELLSSQKAEIEMDFIHAFSKYIPCSGQGFTPQGLADDMAELWGAKTRGEIIEIVRGMQGDTICTSGECKFASYPICRHKMGRNDALTDLIEKIEENQKPNLAL